MGRNARNQIIEVSDVDNIVMELNEGNVQAIFNRCLAKPDFKEMKSYAQVLKPSLAGKSSEDVCCKG